MAKYQRTSQFDFVVASKVTSNGTSVAIQFDDPNFVRAEWIRLDVQSGLLEAVLQEGSHEVGQVSKDLTDLLARQTHVVLSAVRPDGSILEMDANVVLH